MSAEATAPGNDELTSIRQVKDLETETSQKLAAQNERSRTEIDALGRDAEATVAKTRAEAESARDARLAQSRADADREAAKILADGKDRAGQIRGKSPQELAAMKEPIVSAVLGEFRPKGKRAEA